MLSCAASAPRDRAPQRSKAAGEQVDFIRVLQRVGPIVSDNLVDVRHTFFQWGLILMLIGNVAALSGCGAGGRYASVLDAVAICDALRVLNARI